MTLWSVRIIVLMVGLDAWGYRTSALMIDRQYTCTVSLNPAFKELATTAVCDADVHMML